jgi:hypothetical protein
MEFIAYQLKGPQKIRVILVDMNVLENGRNKKGRA